MKIIDAIINNLQESRKEWMLDLFEKNGQRMKSNFGFQFWQHENHPILLSTKEMYCWTNVFINEAKVTLWHRSGDLRQREYWIKLAV